jgi:hypothetical protein
MRAVGKSDSELGSRRNQAFTRWTLDVTAARLDAC